MPLKHKIVSAILRGTTNLYKLNGEGHLTIAMVSGKEPLYDGMWCNSTPALHSIFILI